MSWLLLYFKGMAVLWMMLGFILYVHDPDQKRRVFRHCASLKILSLKFIFWPVTIAVVLGHIAWAPVLRLWRNYAIGCFTGRSGPPTLGPLVADYNPPDDPTNTTFVDVTNGKLSVKVLPNEISCAESVVRNCAATREGDEWPADRKPTFVEPTNDPYDQRDL